MECPGCGVKNPAGSTLCKECGGPLTASEARQSLTSVPPPVHPEGALQAPTVEPGYQVPREGPAEQDTRGAPVYGMKAEAWTHHGPPGTAAYPPLPSATYQQAPQAPMAAPPVYQPVVLATRPVYMGPRSDGLCIAGMVLGIVGLVFFWIPFLPLPCGILGVVFGGIGMRNVQQKPGELTGGGMGVAGIVTGILAVIGGIIMLAVYFASS